MNIFFAVKIFFIALFLPPLPMLCYALSKKLPRLCFYPCFLIERCFLRLYNYKKIVFYTQYIVFHKNFKHNI